ncbi:hypothetical protein ACFL6Z_00865 [Pseudomonadota bacterium]
MLLCTKELFELPIYRLKEGKYYDEFNKYKNEQSLPASDEYHLKSFGGAWKYNEIIGFLKFYISGNTQIRCVYTDTDAERKVKTRKKNFVEKSHSFCTLSINVKASNEDIIDVIEQAIEHCRINLPKNRFLDRTLFDQTFRYVDWQAVMA